MNERIKALADQCSEYDDMIKGIWFDKKKFAELLVRECLGCIDIVGRVEWINPPTYELAIESSKLKIQQHFGVK